MVDLGNSSLNIISSNITLMKNAITFTFRNPLGIRLTGTGAYAKEQLTHLVDLFELAEAEHLEEMINDNE